MVDVISFWRRETVSGLSMRSRGALATLLSTMQLDAVGETREAESSPAADTPAYELGAVYTGDLWRNASGGLRTGNVYLDNLDLTLSIDGERAWGVPGLTAFAYVMYNNHARLSERYIGDLMTVSNIDAPGGVRLYEAWMEWSGDAGAAVRFGLYDLNSEFDASDTRALFIHSAHGVGHELGQTGANGPSIFPVTSLGVRVAWELAQEWRILAAVLDGVPGDRDDPERSGVHLSGDEGALMIAEAQWSSGRVRKLSLGHWQYTADFDDVRSTEQAPLPQRDDNAGSYVDLELALDGAAEREPVTFGFVRYGRTDGRINESDEFFGIGVRRVGLLRQRPDDEFGLAYAWTRIGEETRSAALAAGQRRESSESAIELTYRAQVNEWLTIQPDVQIIFDPGADPGLDDSWAFGLRFELSLTHTK